MDEEIGKIHFDRLMEANNGLIEDELHQDGKKRNFKQKYYYQEKEGNKLEISLTEDFSNSIVVPKKFSINPSNIAFFGMYAGDGAKGSESSGNSEYVKVTVSFSQKNPILAMFCVHNIKEIFGDLPLRCSVAVDSAFFLDKKEMLNKYRQHLISKGVSPKELEPEIDLENFNEKISERDEEYIKNRGRGAAAIDSKNEARDVLKWWYENKKVMKRWLEERKEEQLEKIGIEIGESDEIYGNTRRPFVKGAREPGIASRTDDYEFITLSDYAELFVYLVEHITDSIANNNVIVNEGSNDWLIWNYNPHSDIGKYLNTKKYLQNSEYCKYLTDSGRERRYKIKDESDRKLIVNKPQGNKFSIPKKLKLTPLMMFSGGLYFAEGETSKDLLVGDGDNPPFFKMEGANSSMSLGFTSSSDETISIILNAIDQMTINFKEIFNNWKLKIGSAYIPESIAVAEKNGTTLSRKGKKGQGKSKSLGLALSLRKWALSIIPSLRRFKSRFTHIEPTGSGIPRVHMFLRKPPNIYLLSLFYAFLFGFDGNYIIGENND